MVHNFIVLYHFQAFLQLKLLSSSPKLLIKYLITFCESQIVINFYLNTSFNLFKPLLLKYSEYSENSNGHLSLRPSSELSICQEEIDMTLTLTFQDGIHWIRIIMSAACFHDALGPSCHPGISIQGRSPFLLPSGMGCFRKKRKKIEILL